MDIKKIIAALLLVKTVLSCKESEERIKNNPDKDKDAFYIEDSGFDYVRFPLLKPYEVISLDGKKSWNMKGGTKPKTFNDVNDIFGIKKINIINDNVIICYCEDEPIIAGEKKSKAWFVILTDKSVTRGFINEEDFTEYLKEQGTEGKQIQWKTPEELFKRFSDTYCLPWIPGCDT